MTYGYIVATGYTLPERILGNAELLAQLESDEEWVVSHTGIRERRVAPAQHNTSNLGALAVEAALARSRWAKQELDLLVCATSTPDTLIPATASWIGRELGINPVAFDVNAACSGFVYGLATTTALVNQMGFEKAVLVTAEKYTRVTDYNDRSTCIFFGDSAAAVLVSANQPEVGFEVVDLLMENANEGAEHVSTPVGGTFRQNGRMVKDYALRSFKKSAEEILERNDLTAADLKAFAGHQANMRVLETVAQSVGVKDEQHWHNVSTCGNQGAAGVISAFCQKLEEHEAGIEHGDLFLLTVFGSGFTFGSALLKRIDHRA